MGAPWRPVKYSLDCSCLDPACTLTISGCRDEVLAAGIAHAKKAHGLRDEDEALRAKAAPQIKECCIQWDWKGES